MLYRDRQLVLDLITSRKPSARRPASSSPVRGFTPMFGYFSRTAIRSLDPPFFVSRFLDPLRTGTGDTKDHTLGKVVLPLLRRRGR